MKKRVVLLVLLSFIVGGVVSAASLWGTFKGNQIIRVTVDGVPTKVQGAPAINYSGNVMVPAYLLKQAGIDYQFDKKNQTLNIKKSKVADKPATPPAAKLTVKDIYKLTADAVGYVESLDANGSVACSGSGVMVDPNLFITNNHVVDCGKSGRVNVKIADATYHNGSEGWYMFSNEGTDLYGMVISTSFDSQGVATGKIPPSVFNIVKTKLPEVGDKVYAIGSPYGLENTVTEGVVSGIRNVNGMMMIQHTCNTTHGSSGGALMDEEGFLIGITSSGYDGTNLNFAIPISYVKDEIDKMNKK